MNEQATATTVKPIVVESFSTKPEAPEGYKIVDLSTRAGHEDKKFTFYGIVPIIEDKTIDAELTERYGMTLQDLIDLGMNQRSYSPTYTEKKNKAGEIVQVQCQTAQEVQDRFDAYRPGSRGTGASSEVKQAKGLLAMAKEKGIDMTALAAMIEKAKAKK